jgi:hypothetical protein
MRSYPGDFLGFRLLMISFEASDWWFELVGGFQKLNNFFFFFFFFFFRGIF